MYKDDPKHLIRKLIVPLTAACVIGCLHSHSTQAFDAYETFRQATLLTRSGQYRRAIPLLEQCVKYNENFEEAWVLLGRCEVQSGNSEKGIQALTFAKNKFSNAKVQRSILSSLIFAFGKAGRLEELQAARIEFVLKFPNEPGNEALKKQIEYYDKDFSRTRSIEGRHLVYKLEGYYPWLKFGKMPEMPIKVFIHTGNELKDGSKIYPKAVLTNFIAKAKDACNEWSKATDGNLSFTFVDKEGDSQLVCTWTTAAKSKHHSWASGEMVHDNTSSQGPIRSRAVIFLDPVHRTSDVSFYETTLHEIGHGLGFQHTSNPNDVMYNASIGGAPRKHLSKGDIQLARRVYTDPFLGKAVAENFVRAAYIDKSYEQAYSLLSPEEKNRLNLEQFKDKLSKEATESVPTALSIYRFDRAPYDNKYNFAFEGSNSEKKFYYHVAVVHCDNDEYWVTQARVVSVRPL